MSGYGFALPLKRKYPLFRLEKGKLVPSASHAKNALARAKQAHDRGYLSDREFRQVVRKAKRVLARCRGGSLAHRRGGQRAKRPPLPGAEEQRRLLAAALRAAM